MNNQDNLVANLRQRIRVNKVVHIRHQLAGRGQFLVKKDQVVEPSNIIGRYSQSPGFSVINLAKQLSVPSATALKHLQQPLGSKIFRGELLAHKAGLLGLGRKILTSPTDGILEEYNPQSGLLRLRLLPKDISMLSGVFGVVDKVDDTGVLIRTLATEIEGVFGSGRQRFGILSTLGSKDGILTKNQITLALAAKIIVVGSLIYNDAIRAAINCKVTGIISGGLNARDFQAISGTIDAFSGMGTEVGLSLMATEGFGPMPIGDDIFELLKAFNGNFAFISGNSSRLILPSIDPSSLLTIRKTALPIINKPEKPPEVIVSQIELGKRIRVIWPPYVGSQGKIVAIDKALTRLPSGVMTRLLTIESKTRRIKLPYTNVELIG